MCSHKYLIQRKDKNGFIERIVYTGSQRLIPKGWKLVKRVGCS